MYSLSILSLDFIFSLFCLLSIIVPATSSSTVSDLNSTSATNSSYVPQAIECPASEPPALIRPASGLSSAEISWIASRKPLADQALAKWLSTMIPSFQDANGSKDDSGLQYPTLALANSGGGFRAMLTSAGVVAAMDEREALSSDDDDENGSKQFKSMRGLYQALTYQTGLSGGSWMLGSMAAADWPTVSKLQAALWTQTIPSGILTPDGVLGTVLTRLPGLAVEIVGKVLAGYPVSVVDVWGRLQSYAFLARAGGNALGADIRLSEIVNKGNFSSHRVPFPIITAIGAQPGGGSCPHPPNSPQFEFSPFEYGSWDEGIAAFQATEYMGSKIGNAVSGKGTSDSETAECIRGYDSLGFVMGTSSNIFTVLCSGSLGTLLDAVQGVLSGVQALLTAILALGNLKPGAGNGISLDANDLVLALYPNVFASVPTSSDHQQNNTNSSSPADTDPLIRLVDGGFSGQTNPIWPILHRRSVDVLFVADANNDLPTNFPNGSQLHDTWVQASLLSGLANRMPFIPTPEIFLQTGMNRRPSFFGCNHVSNGSSSGSTEGKEGSGQQLTIIYLPTTNLTTDSGFGSFVSASAADVAGLVLNGRAVATNDGDEGYGLCVACAILNKMPQEELPGECTGCFEKYCYN